MFAKAYQIASNYTQPVLISTLRFDGTVECSVGSFVIVNNEGWIITAAHIFDTMLAHQRDTAEINQYNLEVSEIENNKYLSAQDKKKRLDKVKYNPKWIRTYSYWWGADIHGIDNIHLLTENDIAIGRLTNFNHQFCPQYPVFKKPGNLAIGTSLCKLGYPFHEVKATFNENNNSFQIAPNALPIPRFPIDGIFTREVLQPNSGNNQYDVKFVETSTPGFRGQSGGPIFDTAGNIWAIQSRTAHLALGFSPKVVIDNKEITEHQFINVGMGVHIETILKFLEANKVQYKVSES
ncbi:serine protease [Emticicia sp. BO119]|uniref:S1 family peptidase n=1 Tax=Emticicia sp. BO119 TaxID=2757768 RepID=UPI0015F0D775|nr:serine protease [Emticicia sp. BO119]MBA4852603.1 trypsin-like peptidase domain-containing protein [Emticicia sp. BO119]